MSAKNPFPGMNPWLQLFWKDFHARFLVAASDNLNGALPKGLHARIDQRLAISRDGFDLPPKVYVPDVAITQSWDRSGGKFRSGGAAVADPVFVESAMPEVDSDARTERFIEIVTSRSHVITAIELISPSNKASEEAASAWQRKRQEYLAGDINVVEIDLVRGGVHLMPAAPPPPDRTVFWAAVTRASHPWKHGIFWMPLREPLPAIAIPLRAMDEDVPLDLQALVNECYEKGRYEDEIDYAQPPESPLFADEIAWAAGLAAPGA